MRASLHDAAEWLSPKGALLLLACVGLAACDDPPARGKEALVQTEVPPSIQARSSRERVAEIFSGVSGVTDQKSLDAFHSEIAALLKREDLAGPELEQIVNAILTRADFEVRKGSLPPDFGQVVLAGLAERDPFLAWQMWRAGSVDVRPLAGDRARLKIISRMMERDPVKAIDLLRGDTSNRTPVLRDAFKLWLARDQEGANKWLQDAGDTLNPGESDLLVAAVLDHEGAKSYSKDRDLLAKIHDPTLKKDLAGLLETRKAAELRPAIKGDAAAFVNSLVATRTEESVWSLGVAISEWLRKDPEAVSTWFEDHRGALDGKQADVIVERFANESMRRQDDEAARDWAEDIKDPVLRQEVESRIETKFGGTR